MSFCWATSRQAHDRGVNEPSQADLDQAEASVVNGYSRIEFGSISPDEAQARLDLRLNLT